MVNEKNGHVGPKMSADELAKSGRARNRTVVITSDVASQMRGMLANSEHNTKKREDRECGYANPFEDAEVLKSMIDNSESSEELGLENAEIEDRDNSDSLSEESDSPTLTFSAEETDENPFASSRSENSRVSSDREIEMQSQKATKAKNGGNCATKVASNQSIRYANKVISGPIVGFLVSFDEEPNGEFLPIMAGRWVVTSNDTEDDKSICIKGEGVAESHAVIKVSLEGVIQIMDQLSDGGTGICHKLGEKEVVLSGSMGEVGHGARVRFGTRRFQVCLLA